MTDVFILIAYAVYDQGIYGVFDTSDAAVAHGEALWDESDGHHQFRVERWRVGQAAPADMTIRWYGANQEAKRLRIISKWDRPPVPVTDRGETP